MLATIPLAPGNVIAQTADARKVGIVLIAHGGSPEWNSGVLTAAAAVRDSMPIEVAFLMGPDAPRYRFHEQVAKLERTGVRRIVVVPLLVSSHSGHYEQLRWLARETDSLDTVMQHHLHMSGIERPQGPARLLVARALDDAPELSDILSARALELAKDPRAQALLLIGHGPNSAEDYAAWMQNLRRVAERVQAKTGFQDVKVELVRDDAAPAVRAEAVLRAREIVSLQSRMTGSDVVVVPVLIARSSVGDQRIRSDLAGLPIVYSGAPILPHPLIARWIQVRAREALGVARP
jgi:sirohydrochlorin ferrochelatase